MITPDEIASAVRLFDEGTDSSRAKAFAIVRKHYRSIRSFKECEIQILQWKKQAAAPPASSEVPGRSDEQALLEAVVRFDLATLDMLSLIRDAKLSHTIGSNQKQVNASDVLGAAALVITGMVVLIEAGKNPLSAVSSVLRAMRQYMFSQTGEVTPSRSLNETLDSLLSSGKLEADDTLRTKLAENNLMRDLLEDI
jgi:hypothetical protein